MGDPYHASSLTVSAENVFAPSHQYVACVSHTQCHIPEVPGNGYGRSIKLQDATKYPLFQYKQEVSGSHTWAGN